MGGRIPNPERVWKFIKFPKDLNECWIWKGVFNDRGYGVFGFNSKKHKAHRFIYEYLVGEIAKGLVTDHLCRNRKCVNPEHLEFVTDKININRGIGNRQKEKTCCPLGHKYTKENTYYYKNSRTCRKCSALKSRIYRRKQKESVPIRLKI